MSKGSGLAGFVLGSVVGAAAGAVLGIMVANRQMTLQSAPETTGAASMVDAWGNPIDGASAAAGTESIVDDAASALGLDTDELRAKVAKARARVEEIRAGLAQNVGATIDSAVDALHATAVSMSQAVEAQMPPQQVSAEVVDGEAPAGTATGTQE